MFSVTHAAVYKKHILGLTNVKVVTVDNLLLSVVARVTPSGAIW